MASSSQVRQSRREELEARRVAAAQKDRRNRILLFSGGIIVVIVVVALAVWGVVSASTKGGTDTPPNANAAKNGIMLTTADNSGVVEGVPTFEMFSDYNCSACKSANLTLSAAMDQLVTNKQLNVVIHSMQFEGSTSRDAAVAAACSDSQGVFTPFHNQLYINQSTSGFDSAMLRATIPATVGLTGDQLTAYQTCFDSKATGGFVDGEAAYASKMKVGTTPTFYLDGEDVTTKLYNQKTGTYDPDLLRQLVNEKK
ncbi:MAG: DsbA family protein [Propionibacteriaceae bacterium]|nr:DsbA family protein [Propionibacteriaceae bacterium]